MSDKKHGGLVDGLRHIVDHAAVAAGIAEEVPAPIGDDEAQDVTVQAPPPSPPASRRQPTVPGGGTKTSAPSVSSSDSNADVDEQFRAHYPTILMAMPPSLQKFLEQKGALMDSLRESVDPAKLEAAATKGALAIAKLTPKDVKDGMTAARNAVRSLRSDFDASVAQKRKESIEAPTQKIEEVRNQINQIGSQIANLQQRQAALQAGIEPQQQAIAEAERNLEYGVTVFGTSCDRIDQALLALENQLSGIKGGK